MREATRARAVLAVLLLASITLVLLDVRGSAAVGGMRAIVAAIVGPVEQAVGAVAAPFIGVAQSAMSFGDTDERTGEAAQQLGDLANGSAAATQNARQAQEVESLLRTAGIGGYQVVAARVVAYGSAQTFSGTITVDAGSGDGISADMTVITGDGLVGKVVSTSPTTATVQLLTDDNSIVGARIESTSEAGALQGTGQPGEAVLRPLDPTAGLRVGDRLVTFGSPDGRPYAPGIPLGTITALRGDPGQAERVALVKPAARLTALDIVGIVVVPPRTDPRDSVLPPKPSAVAKPSSPPGQ